MCLSVCLYSNKPSQAKPACLSVRFFVLQDASLDISWLQRKIYIYIWPIAPCVCLSVCLKWDSLSANDRSNLQSCQPTKSTSWMNTSTYIAMSSAGWTYLYLPSLLIPTIESNGCFDYNQINESSLSLSERTSWLAISGPFPPISSYSLSLAKSFQWVDWSKGRAHFRPGG